MRVSALSIWLLALAQVPALAAGGSSPSKLLQAWQSEAGANAAFSAVRGKQLFERKTADWSCSTCHTADPRRAGKHVVTGKAILPLAPSANPQRFTDAEKVEKWFRRNCRDVLDRECTVLEKGDLLTWLVSLR